MSNIPDNVDLLRICEQNHGKSPMGGFTRHYLMLYSLVYGMEAQNVFEFGMGFSTQTIIEALKSTGGKLTTVDRRATEDFHYEPIFEDDLGIWTFHCGLSEKIVPSLNHSPYDMVLHDGSHGRERVCGDLNNILPYIKKGGLLLVHDTNHSRKGCVLGPQMRGAIKDSNLKDYEHERLNLPYSFGLTIVRLLSSKTDEEVQINWKPK